MMGVGRREKKRRPFFEVLGGKKKSLLPQGGRVRKGGRQPSHKMAGNYRCVCLCVGVETPPYRITLWVDDVSIV